MLANRIHVALLLLTGSLQAQVAVVNGASFRGNQQVAAGSWVAAFGAFTGVPTTTAQTLPLPKSLGGVRVTVAGAEAPLFDVRSNQITFLIPYSTAPGIHPIQVTLPGGAVNGTVSVITAAPGLFTKDSATTPKGAILNQDGVTENSSAAPARRGEVISIYATGPGRLSRTVGDGEAPGTPIAATVSTPQVYIGGVEAPVQFSGLNPNAPGLWQINALIPNQPFITGRVAVIVYMDGVDSNEVALFVQ